MRLKIWLNRLRGLRIKGFQKRRANGCQHQPNSVKAKTSSNVPKSPLHVSAGILSIPNSQQEDPCLSPFMDQKASSLVSQRILTLSPLSPLPSPALANTPTCHPSPLALKDLLSFEAHDGHQKTNKFSRIVANLGCYKRQKSEKNPKSNGANKGCRDDHQNHVNTIPGDHENTGSLQGSRGRWTGACKCMLVNAEKGLVKTRVLIRRKQRATPHRGSALLSTKKQHDMVTNRQSKNTSSVKSRQLNASMDRTKSTTKPPIVSNNPTLTLSRRFNTWSKERSSLASDENFFTDKGRPSESSSFSSYGVVDKINQWGLHDARNAEKGLSLAHEWLREGRIHQETAKQSHRLASNLYNQEIDCDNHSGLGSEEEEESLLQADSYASSETFSISSHSPWLNDINDVASPNTSVDLEAHAKSWVSTEKHISMGKKQGNRGKSKRGDAKAIRRKYHKAFGQQPPMTDQGTKTETIILPCCEIKKGNDVLKPLDNHDNDGNKRVEKAVGESLAVEKRSHDPYVDFTDSMVDMILQNHICSSSELEGLLQCFLSLNSLDHHDLIVQAFTEVWEKVVMSGTAYKHHPSPGNPHPPLVSGE